MITAILRLSIVASIFFYLSLLYVNTDYLRVFLLGGLADGISV
ncbi:hypothetical protein VAE122_3690001 [Vibrio aestuarianus]|nr:hypothetical protein VAEU17_4280052 [Vibrio aestuarianus]CAH8242268.1 hypothetical protein VAE122_3690001 [Vibrio aestuarianus]